MLSKKTRGEPLNNDLEPVQKHIKIESQWNGLTLMAAVRNVFPDISPPKVFKKSRMGEILLNGKRQTPTDRLNTGDIVTVVLHLPRKPETKPILFENISVLTPCGPFLIVREDEDLLVASKPPACASHPAARRKGDTMIERIRHYLGSSTNDPFQPALANRLDLDTSGLILVGKNKPAQKALGRHFQKGLIEKHYICLVDGWPAPMDGEISEPLMKHPDSRELMKFVLDRDKARASNNEESIVMPKGKIQQAATRYWTIQRFDQPFRTTLLKIQTLTGRLHQIRRHLQGIGHPLAGDRRYGNEDFNADMRDVCDLKRLFLHAASIGLTHPATGEKLKISTPPPEDLTACMKTFGLHDFKFQ